MGGLLVRRGRIEVGRLAAQTRGRHLFVLDLIGMAIAAYLALSFRYDRFAGPGIVVPLLPLGALLLAVQAAVNIRLGLYSRGWRFATVSDLVRIVLAGILGTSLTGLIMFFGLFLLGVDWAAVLPRSFWPAVLVLGVAVLGGLRFAIRATHDWANHPPVPAPVDGSATLLFGAGQTGVLIARSAKKEPTSKVKPVGFLDDDPAMYGTIVAGLPVFGGVEALERAVAATGARTLLITMPGAPGKEIRRVTEAGMAAGLEVRTVPSMNDVIDGKLDAYRARLVRVEDLLRRPIATGRAAGVREIIEGQTVLITGAGGSIGSELARQVFGIGPRRLVLVDRAESPLYLVQRELDALGGSHAHPPQVVGKLANVVSRAAMERLVSAERPSIILHAAAYKHVPMLEQHPSDAMHVNVGGTLVMLEAALAADVERFVLVSTDKAVRPTSVMGASKRLAEMLVSDASNRVGKPYVSVRFGNVLGSTGSVVPIFQDQLERSRPLTITHPEMTRFFMTIPEAAWLILDAAALGRTGDLFVLDMGQPVRIVDLARDLVRLAGRDPESQPIEIIGLRPGEKLHEELFYDGERVEPTAVEKVLRAIAEPPPTAIRDDVRRMLELADGDQEPALRAALLAYAPAGPPAWTDRPAAAPVAVGPAPA